GASVGVRGDHVELRALQPLSLSGEGRFAHRAARFRIDAAEAGLRRVRLETAAEARRRYVAAVATAQVAELAAEGVALAERLREAVARQVELGEAPRLDLQLARLAEARAVAEVLEARDEAA